jgi:hypothetical protein
MATLANIARVYTNTAGTGTITLGSPVTGFKTFAQAGISDGQTVSYAIEDRFTTVGLRLMPSAREVGRGVYTASGTTLTRNVLLSTNSNTAIDLSGVAEVFITALAEDFLGTDHTYRVITAAGGVTVDAEDDDIVVIKKTVGEATAVTLPLSLAALRPMTIKDGNGDSDTYNITITPNGAETIDGLSSVTLNFAYQAVTLYPYPDGSGWFLA